MICFKEDWKVDFQHVPASFIPIIICTFVQPSVHGSMCYVCNDEGEGSLSKFNIFDPLHAYRLVMVQMDFEHGLNKSPPPAVV